MNKLFACGLLCFYIGTLVAADFSGPCVQSTNPFIDKLVIIVGMLSIAVTCFLAGKEKSK